MSRDSSIDSLYPVFADQVRKFSEKLETEGINAYPFETLRTFERQLELYAKGRKRTPNGSWIVVDESAIVTKARPGFSWHTYGVAVDFVFDGNPHKAGIQWSWEDADVTKAGNQPLPWADLGRIGKDCGLEWAGDWVSFKEYPHFQNTFGFKLHQVHDVFGQGGLKAVWKEFDKIAKKTVVTVEPPQPEPVPIHDDDTDIIDREDVNSDIEPATATTGPQNDQETSEKNRKDTKRKERKERRRRFWSKIGKGLAKVFTDPGIWKSLFSAIGKGKKK